MATEKKRFGYCIAQPDGTMDFFVHKECINAALYNALQNNIIVILNLRPITIAFDVVFKNYFAILSSRKSYKSHLTSLGQKVMTQPSIILNGLALVTQRLSNFLSSASAFLKQTESQLKTIYGANAAEFVSWNEAKKYLHASSFSYRFMYELRNYSQHKSIPLSNFNISGKLTNSNMGMLFKADAFIIRDELLKEKYNWKRLKAEIEKQPPIFAILPHAKNYFYDLCKLFLKSVSVQETQLMQCALYLKQIRDTYGIPLHALPVIFIGESIAVNIPPAQVQILPFAELEYIINKYEYFGKKCEVL